MSPSEPGKIKNSTELPPLPSVEVPPSKPMILVVDDDEQLRRLVSLALRKECHILEAGNATEAIKVLDHLSLIKGVRSQVSLVLLDIMMPGIDGLSLCRRIKNEFGVPVIMCSSRAGEQDVGAALRCGADDYLAKPFDLRTLVEKISKHARADTL